ncbi:MAG: CCA tRNA nucleotidyltransferase [Thermoplasmata archaeon]|nr:MAG: CCA tRNA nucleotidyltransferase [Thermoplasmata archaeon]
MNQRFYISVIILVVIIHLIEVNFIDSYATNFVGRDFSILFQSVEGDSVRWFADHWIPYLTLLFIIIYIIIYPFTLWFSPLLFVLNNERKALRALAVGLVIVYTIALPFYLFFPVTNVYTYYSLNSAFSNTIPSMEHFFYATTTYNNCFPSLHVAMALLIAKSSSFVSNRRYQHFTLVTAAGVIISVIYLAIHWFIDVIGGIAVFIVASLIVDYSNSIEQEIIRKVTPSFRERKAINETVVELIKRVQNYCSKKGIEATPLLVGSVAKDTYLRDSVDIDIFVLFPKSTPRDLLEKQGLSIGRAILIEREEKYAEHPYVRGKFNGFDAEIVPCYRIKNINEKISAVDRTPFHTEFVKKNLPIWKRNQVRLLKQFLKGIGCYGAEAEVEGFSGYLCELLIIKYGSFRRLLKNAKNWEIGKTVIKIRDRQSQEFSDPLVVIDPVDPNRNVASALSKEKLSLFIRACRDYLQEPKMTFFFPNEIKPLSPSEIKKQLSKSNFVGIKIPKPDIISDNLYPQIRKSLKRIVECCKREGFEILDFRFVVKQDNIYLILKLKDVLLSETSLHRGPPDREREHVKSFREKWDKRRDVVKGPYLKDGRWYVEVRRKYREPMVFLEDKLPTMSLGKSIQSEIAEKGFDIILSDNLFDNEDLREFWTEYLDERMPWER